MTTEERIKAIQERLTSVLAPTHLSVVDEGYKHIGHSEAQGAGHFAITIASPQFIDKNLINCHREIYQALGDLMEKEIHALKIYINK